MKREKLEYPHHHLLRILLVLCLTCLSVTSCSAFLSQAKEPTNTPSSNTPTYRVITGLAILYAFQEDNGEIRISKELNGMTEISSGTLVRPAKNAASLDCGWVPVGNTGMEMEICRVYVVETGQEGYISKALLTLER
jgi:hypothetical protein